MRDIYSKSNSNLIQNRSQRSDYMYPDNIDLNKIDSNSIYPNKIHSHNDNMTSPLSR